jgi:hypothetical protein
LRVTVVYVPWNSLWGILWHAPTEDAAVRDSTDVSGQACLMHPRVMLMNDDAVSLIDCCRFIRRQLLGTRRYPPG